MITYISSLRGPVFLKALQLRFLSDKSEDVENLSYKNSKDQSSSLLE